jgi:hypothetical protein
VGLDARNRALGWGGWIAAVCAALLAIGALLELIYVAGNHAPAGIDVSDTFAFVGPILAVLGACFVGAAFLGSPASRAGRLIAGIGLSAAYYLCACASAGFLGGYSAAHHLPGG